jgi:hypothetical protein
MSFDNIVFAGSVVPRSFPWDQIDHEHRVGRVRNYIASADWVVAIFPAVFEVLSRRPDLGSAGHNGFLDNTGMKYAIEFADGGHGAAIAQENFDAIARFVLGDEVSENEHRRAILTDKQVGASVLANKFCWFVWLVLIGLAVTTCFGSVVAWMLGQWNPDVVVFARWIPWWGPPVVGPPTIYAVLRFV